MYSHQESPIVHLLWSGSKAKKLYIVPLCLLWSEPAETNQNAFTWQHPLHLLARYVFELMVRKSMQLPPVLPEVNKDMQQTAHWRLILSLVILYYIVCINHFRQYITFENEAQMRLENNVLMHCKRRRRIASHQISMRLRPSSQPQACPWPAITTKNSSSHNAQRSWLRQLV